MTQGIVLAGGRSRRASTNKLLYDLGGKTIVAHAVDSMRPFVTEIIVVTGAFHEALAQARWDGSAIRLVYNPDHLQGMFTSVLCGAKETVADIFILPADCPLVSKETYRELLNGTGEIRVPRYAGRLGHPIWLSKAAADMLKREPANANLKTFRNRHGFEDIATDDPEVLTDMDTYEALEMLKQRYERMDGHEH